MTNEHGAATTIAEAIRARLEDQSTGRRSMRWLSERTGIPYSTLQWKLGSRPGRLNTDELFAIADAFGCDLSDLYRAPAPAPAAVAS